MGYDAERAEDDYWTSILRHRDVWRLPTTTGTTTERRITATSHRHTQEDDIIQDCPCYNKKENNVSRKAAVLAHMRMLQEELVQLEKRPQEPTREGDEPLIIFFSKRFGGEGSSRITSQKWYDYCFIKAGGRWNGTGPRAPKAYSWDELIDWLESSGPMPIIYQVKKIKCIFEPEVESGS